jgi:hypothetical protein
VQGEKKERLKEKAKEEGKLFVLISAYLFVFFAAFLAYRRLISRELGASYLRYGFALIEALVIAKVILIGKAIGIGGRHTGKPLILSTLRASVAYGAFVAAFAVLEHLVEGLVHGKTLGASFADFWGQGSDEMIGKTMMMFLAFLPFFAFWEVGRVVGGEKLLRLFFRGGEPDRPAATRA